MKRIYCILLTVMLLWAGASQAGEQWKYSRYRSEGFTLGFTVGQPQITSMQIGWQMGPNWNVAVELGAARMSSSLDVRYYLNDRRVTPFVEARVSKLPALLVGFALGHLEVGIGAFCPSAFERPYNDDYYHYDQGYGNSYYGGYGSGYHNELPNLFWAATLGYTFTFGKW